MAEGLVEWALHYATVERWAVIPLHSIGADGICSCRTHCPSPGKHPRTPNGVLDATTDPDIVRAWWTQWPDANIGVATGEISGLIVLDVDAGRSAEVGGRLVPEGEHSLLLLEEEHGPLPATLQARTGSGGRHILFTRPSGGSYRNRARMAPSLDVRGDGGYIVAPPSLHASGHRYEWSEEGGENLADLPAWLATLISQSSRPEAGLQVADGEKIGEGGRNDYLFRLACSYREKHGHTFLDLFGIVMAHNLNDCDPPLTPDEVRRIAMSASTYEAGEPEPTWGLPSERVALSDVPPIPDGADLAISLGSLLANPPEKPQPLVHGLIDCGTGIILGGQPNVGKSWLAFHLAVSVATGTPYLGMPTEQGNVLVIDEEGHPWSNYQRFSMLLEGAGVTGRDIPIYLAMGKGLKLSDPIGAASVRRMVERYQPKLVVIDSLVRVNGGSENSSNDMANFFDVSKRMMQTYGCSILFIHHVRKPSLSDTDDVGDLLRGSTEIRAWPDTVIVARPGNTADEVRVDHVKARHSRRLDPFLVQMVIDDRAGVARFAHGGPVVETASTNETRNKLVQSIQDLTFAGKQPTAQALAAQLGLTEVTVRNHLDALVAIGRLEKRPGTEGTTKKASVYVMAH